MVGVGTWLRQTDIRATQAATLRIDQRNIALGEKMTENQFLDEVLESAHGLLQVVKGIKLINNNIFNKINQQTTLTHPHLPIV